MSEALRQHRWLIAIVLGSSRLLPMPTCSRASASSSAYSPLGVIVAVIGSRCPDLVIGTIIARRALGCTSIGDRLRNDLVSRGCLPSVPPTTSRAAGAHGEIGPAGPVHA